MSPHDDPTTNQPPHPAPGRRRPATPSRFGTRMLLAGTVLTGAVLALAACGSDDDDPDDAASLAGVTIGATPTTSETTPTPTGTAGAGTPSTTTTGGTTGSLEERLLGIPAGAPLSAHATVDTGAELEIDDQSGDGRTVRVAEARVTRGTGFVVIMTPGRDVLGAAKLTPSSSPVSVRLDRPVTSSGEYLGLLYVDNGDGRFDPGSDLLVIDEDELDLRRADAGELSAAERATMVRRLADEAVDEDFDYRVA